MAAKCYTKMITHIDFLEKEAGLSTPEYVKGILKKYFDEHELQENEYKVLQEIREENQKLIEMIGECIQQTVVIGYQTNGYFTALRKMC